MLYETRRWLAWNQPSNIQMMLLPLEAAMINLKRHYGHSWPLTILIYEGDQVYWINRWEELRALGEKMLDALLLPGAAAHFFEQDFKERTIILANNISSTIKRLATETASGADLSEMYGTFTSSYKDWYAVAWCAEPIQFAAEEIVSFELKRLVELKRIEGQDEVQGKVHLFSPSTKSFLAEIEISLANCARALVVAAQVDATEPVNIANILSELHKISKEVVFDEIIERLPQFSMPRKLLHEHAAMYYWKRNNYLRTEELTAKDIFDEVNSVLDVKGLAAIEAEISHIETIFSGSNEQRNRLYRALEPYHKGLVDILGQNALLKDTRKATIQQVNHVVSLFMDKLCELSVNIDRRLALQLSPPEVEEAFKDGVTSALLETLEERCASAVVFWGSRTLRLLSLHH